MGLHSSRHATLHAMQILTSGHDTGSIEVCYAEEVLADLWANSTAGKEEFPDHPEVVRRAVGLKITNTGGHGAHIPLQALDARVCGLKQPAIAQTALQRNLEKCHAAGCMPRLTSVFLQVALGRLALEPLAVLASLCRPGGNEILSLNLHPLQSHVPQADLLKAAEMTLVTAANQVRKCIAGRALPDPSQLPIVKHLPPKREFHESQCNAVMEAAAAVSRLTSYVECRSGLT